MGGRSFLTRLIFGEGAARRRLERRTRSIRSLPDRRVLMESYLPALAAEGGRILWVGCRAYTAFDYAVLESRGGEVWTTDIDPDAARWGVAGRHRTGDVCAADRLFEDLMFDAIVCNGVLGYGADTEEQQRQALEAQARILKPGGRLLLGWNTDKISDPIAAALASQWFRSADFAGQPARVRFDDVTHVYDSLMRI